MNATYVIREEETGAVAKVTNFQGAFHEGQDGKERAEELAEIHNRLYPNNKWKVVQETF